MTKPSNLPPASSVLWDLMELAASNPPGGTPAFAGPGLVGIGSGTPGLVHYLAVERTLAAAADAGLDPVDWANAHVAEIAGYYELLVYALKAAGFGVGSPILDTTRPLFGQGEPTSVAAANSALAALPAGTAVILSLHPATVTGLMAAGLAGNLPFPVLADLFPAIGKARRQ